MDTETTIETAKVFTHGRSQAVRLPKAYRFDEDEVYIKRVGSAVLLFSKRAAFDLFDEAIAECGGQFPDREQPEDVERRKPL